MGGKGKWVEYVQVVTCRSATKRNEDGSQHTMRWKEPMYEKFLEKNHRHRKKIPGSVLGCLLDHLTFVLVFDSE